MKVRHLTHCNNLLLADEMMQALQDAGIVCGMHDETINEMAGLYRGDAAGYNLMVDADRYDEALALVGRIRQQYEDYVPSCPVCDSSDVEWRAQPGRVPRSLWWLVGLAIVWTLLNNNILSWVVTGVFLIVCIIAKRTRPDHTYYHCRQCDNDFDND